MVNIPTNMPPKRPYGRPPGLKGRDIGLYYKSLQGKRGRTEQQPTINLKIPRNVTSKIEHNLTCIKKLARDLQIPIKPMDKLYLFEAAKDNATSDSTSSDKGTCSIKMDIDDSRGLKQSLKSDQPKSDNPASNATNTQCDSDSTDMKPPKSCESIQNYKKPDSSKGRDEFSSNLDFIKIGNEDQSGYDKPGTSKSQHSNSETNQRQLYLREAKAFKYGYEDIIKDSFDDKLDECLARANVSLKENEDLNLALYEEYKDMMTRKDYKRLLQFRQMLPAFKNSEELLKVIKDNQVVVISGETGCGKSTQVPQIILDDALSNKIGSKVKVLVTQPRRIAASSLAKRVSEERGERMGNSVGYAVRLEKVDPRPHGSIQFCTTGILLTELEVDQGLGHFSHVILDEVHERDTHIDLALCMLKKVLNKRKDLKLILMSATIDAEKLSEYFSNCPMMHIEGLAYPVKDIYLEEILMMTKYCLPVNDKRMPNYTRPWQRHLRKNKLAEANITETDIKYRAEIGPWLETKKRQLDRNVFHTLLDARIEELNIDLIYELLKHICKGDPGAILVFLPGIGDITKLLRKMTEYNDFPQSAYEIYPLHSKLPSLEQHKIFERPPSHIRKIIIATNIAETSITIDDIVYVVDCGKIKYSGLNIEDNVSTLKTEWVSQANLRQRRGRAGRCQPGICYHLVTSFRAEKLEERLKPEIQRSNLLEAVLTVKRLRLGKAEDALNSMPAPPALSTIQSAITHLQKCGALDMEEKLTPLGWHLARLPVHPAAGKLLLLGALFGCLDRAASVAAVWGFKDPFLLVIGKEQEVDEARRALAQGEPSDHVAMSEAIINWEMCSKAGRRNFAYDNFLSNNTIEMLSEMKKQFGENLKQMGFLASGNVKSAWENRNSDNFSLFKAIVAAALYPNIATVKWINLNARNVNKRIRIKAKTPEDGPILLHPSSVMANGYGRGNSDIVCVKPGANWLVYWLKQRSSDLFLIDVTLVYTLPLLFFGEFNVTKDDSSTDCLMSISTIKVRCNKETTQLLYEMRSLLDQVLASKITSGSQHSTKHNQFDEKVLNAVIEIITAEDERAEFLNESDMSDSDQSEYGSSRSWYK